MNGAVKRLVIVGRDAPAWLSACVMQYALAPAGVNVCVVELPPRTASVNQLRGHFFPRSGFAGNQHGGVGWRDAIDELEHFSE